MTDILIYESGNGGDILLRGEDLVKVNGYENAPYLAMFGGSDWWGNYLIPDKPFNAKTENVLKSTPLTSNGRILIENAIREDLTFLNNIVGTTATWKVAIAQANRVSIEVTINGQVFNYMWNPDELYLTYIV